MLALLRRLIRSLFSIIKKQKVLIMPNMDEEEKRWVEERNRAKAKQLSLKNHKIPTDAEWDETRKAQAEKQAAAAKAMAVTPGTLGGRVVDPWDIDTAASMPSNTEVTTANTPQPRQTPTPVAPDVSASQNSILVIWQCTVSLGTIYAPSWDVLKQKVKDIDGSHKVLEYRFANTIDNVLGFFVPDQYPNTHKPSKTFDIIVQGGKVFRDEG